MHYLVTPLPKSYTYISLKPSREEQLGLLLTVIQDIKVLLVSCKSYRLAYLTGKNRPDETSNHVQNHSWTGLYPLPLAYSNLNNIHPHRFIQRATRIDSYKHSYFPSTICMRNRLPTSIIMSESLCQFKNCLSVF